MRPRPSASAVRTASGGWSWRVRGIRQVPYRLPELLSAALDVPVFVVEGEKDADRLASLGLVATCNAGGANTWPEALNPPFRGRTVYILPDNDAAGRSHASKGGCGARRHRRQRPHRPAARPRRRAATSPTGSTTAAIASELLALCQLAPEWKPASRRRASRAIPSCSPTATRRSRWCSPSAHVDDLRYCEVFGSGSSGRTAAGARTSSDGSSRMPAGCAATSPPRRSPTSRMRRAAARIAAASPPPRRWRPSSTWRAPMPGMPRRRRIGMSIRGR